MYVPKVGERVKLKEMCDYNELMRHDPTMVLWAHLEVLEVEPTHVTVIHDNAGKHVGAQHRVKLELIKPPWGWEPVYTIECSDDDTVKRVIETWFGRGISVWVDHNMSTRHCGAKAFMPLVDGKVPPCSPGWQYTGNPLEIVEPDECRKRFKVVRTETHCVSIPTTKQKAARRGAVQQLRKQHPGAVIRLVGDDAEWETETVVHDPQNSL
jgi:hypothetical protein